ncbi:MAG: methyltransferase domain-containing protein [Candidatus Hydrogenedentota bacterium]
MDSTIKDYGVSEETSLLQIGCEKGFLLHDYMERFPRMKIRGHEISSYAIENAMPSVKPMITCGGYGSLPFKDHEFDFVMAMGVVYTLTLADAISCLKEIQRVGKGRSFITLGAFRDAEGERLFRMWTVLGATILHVDDWVEVLKEAGYTGDYHFMTSEYLNLADVPPEA